MANIYDQLWQTAKDSHSGSNFIIVEHGWEQHVIIDVQNKLVYRYPRSANAALKLVDEVALLRELNKSSWPIHTPNLRTHTATYTVYDYIPGDVLTQDTISGLSDDQLHEIGDGLGKFLASLHKSDHKVIEQKQTKQTMSLLEYYKIRIDSAPKSQYYVEACSDLEQLTKIVSQADQVVVHGDLHGLNIVISPSSKKLVGVIDFSELEIGDRNQDFRKLFMTDERLLDSGIDSYQTASGAKLSRDAILLWAYINEWANLCYFSDQPDNLTYIRAKKHLEKWHKI